MRNFRSALSCAALLCSALAIGTLLYRHTAAASDVTPDTATILAKPLAPAMTATPTKPSWKQLTPAQQQALAPLAVEWDAMERLRKEKWLAIGNKYARMTATEQERAQARMRDWVTLTPQERHLVRESYISANKLHPAQKSAQWQQYQQLSDQQKQQLATQIMPDKPVTAITRSKPPNLLPIKPEPTHDSIAVPAITPLAPASPVANK